MTSREEQLMPAPDVTAAPETVAGADGAAPAKALLRRIDASIDAFGQAVRRSTVEKRLRKDWQDFARQWRAFLLEEKSHPSTTGMREASRFASELVDWKKRFTAALRHPERDGMEGAPVSPSPSPSKSISSETPTVTPGSIRYEWQASKKEVDDVDRDIMPSDVSDTFKQAWRRYAGHWQQAFERCTANQRLSPAASWRLARAYRHRTRAWAQAFGRECSGNHASSELGALIVTPGAMLDELNTVNNGVKQLDADISASKVREAFKKAWADFTVEWKKFYDSKQGFFSRTWGSTMEKTIEYRKRVDEWRAAFNREGGLTTGPTLNVPEPKGATGGSWRWWAVGGLLAGGAYIGVKVLR
ncbi:MAG: hypothetical protein SF187_23635 [Deltaproteobacteria bacterium]|nr:hypothetical protein [Deltaproteobacteria bacterium]